MARILLIDNYDSFTNNIAEYLYCTDPVDDIKIVKNDFDVWAMQSFKDYDAIVISPGPGSPIVSTDIGITYDIMRGDSRPILGICLGHQVMGVIEGASAILAPSPFHGRKSRLVHNQCGLFKGLPKDLSVVRYHSWILESSLPDTLICDAKTECGIVMAVRHTCLPRWGLQFHPESIGTDFGKSFFRNFMVEALAA